MATQVAEDYTKADLNTREKLIADMAVKVTRSPDACSPADIQKLRSEGFSDKDILSLIEIIAYQNMSTRLMESLSTVERGKLNISQLVTFVARTIILRICRFNHTMQKIHTGFHVHSKVRATSKQEAERIGKYMIRPILSLKRLSIDKAKGKVCYQYGKDSSGLEQMDYLEFIARVTSHIPDKGQVMIRYYGLYANAHRGKINKAGVLLSHPPIIGEEERFVPSKGWAEMIRKVFEVDPLLCPACGGQMSIISFIEDHKVIDKIIDHLKLTFMAERPPPPQRVRQELLMAAEKRGDYF